MNRVNTARAVTLFVMLLIFSTRAYAQAPSQNITVTVLPASPVEERVANEMKEKELRKAAEERRAAEEAARIAETSPKALLSRARVLFMWSNTDYFEEHTSE